MLLANRATMLAVGLLVGVSVGTAEARRCIEGRFVLDPEPLVVTPDLVIEAVEINRHEVTIADGCELLRSRIRGGRHRTRVAALLACEGLPGPLKLRARIRRSCARMRGRVRVRMLDFRERFEATVEGEGCAGNTDCADERYCARRAGDCDGAGTCRTRPDACPAVAAPVCSCDGSTYENECEAAAAGVNVARAGPCDAECGTIVGIECPEGLFCEFAPGHCDGADLAGRCVPVSDLCPLFFDPVCGCDGKTYGNDCERRHARVQKAHDGSCDGCLSNEDCEPEQFCAKEPPDCDGYGLCILRATDCPDVPFDPVCGCDGVTYGSVCEAAATGVSIATRGTCERPPCAVGCGDAGCKIVCPCEMPCDCYLAGLLSFEQPCPLLCPNCGNYWDCVEGVCVERCGMIPIDIAFCPVPID